MAVRRAPADAGAAPVWSLLLPAHWVPPVWHALVFAGARPAGLRECAALSIRHLSVCRIASSSRAGRKARDISGKPNWFMSNGVTSRVSAWWEKT